MKISFLIRSLNVGGAETQLVILAGGLHKREHEVSVIVFYSGGALQRELEESGVTVYCLEKKGRWDLLLFVVRLIRCVSTLRPEILYGLLTVPNLLTVLLKLRFPRMKVVWGLRSSNVQLSQYDWLVRLSARAEIILSRFADVVIANSMAGGAHAVSIGFPEKKLIVIPNGIDTERFRPDAGAGANVRRELGLTQAENLIGIVARLDPVKNHRAFLNSAAMLLQHRDDVRFLCVGDGPETYKRELLAEVEKLGLENRVIWAGTRRDLHAVYSSLHIAVCISQREGFPNAVGEAMACGVPCVVTDVGDCAMIVGESGLVAHSGSPEEICSIWAGLLDRDQKEIMKIGSRLRSRVIEHFSIAKLISQTEAALWQLG